MRALFGDEEGTTNPIPLGAFISRSGSIPFLNLIPTITNFLRFLIWKIKNYNRF